MKVHIENPCHENLANMTATEKGRFCAVCEKEVIDFTKFTDAEIKAYLTQNKAGGCGTFRQDQLNRTLVQTTPTRPLKTSRWLMSFALMLGACDSEKIGKAETKETECKKPINISPAISGELAVHNGYETIPIQGVAMRGYGNDAKAWVGIKVEVKGKDIFCLTDSNGRFLLHASVHKDSVSAKITLLFTDEEGKVIEQEIDKNSLDKENIFYIEFDEERLEEIRNGEYAMIDLPTQKPNVWQKIKKMFQKDKVA